MPMNDQHCDITPESHRKGEVHGKLWPSSTYTQQVEALKNAKGKKVYLVELKLSDIKIGTHLSDTAYELLDVVDFPRPDPAKGIAPHLILLDDGRGINLGRIARITLNTPFSPLAANILYQDMFLIENLLLHKRRLSKASIAAKSKVLLGIFLGKLTDNQITRNDGSTCTSDTFTHSKQAKRSQQKPLLPK